MVGFVKKVVGTYQEEGRNKGGFGFITPEDRSKDVFFHMADLQGLDINEMQPGDAVKFDVIETDRGLKAIAICAA